MATIWEERDREAQPSHVPAVFAFCLCYSHLRISGTANNLHLQNWSCPSTEFCERQNACRDAQSHVPCHTEVRLELSSLPGLRLRSSLAITGILNCSPSVFLQQHLHCSASQTGNTRTGGSPFQFPLAEEVELPLPLSPSMGSNTWSASGTFSNLLPIFLTPGTTHVHVSAKLL